jgi:hypothetical protein
MRRKAMPEKNNQELKSVQRKKLNRKIDALGWGLFFVWTGIAVLTDAGWGVGLIGVGLIIIGSLAAREYLSDPEDCSGATNVNC